MSTTDVVVVKEHTTAVIVDPGYVYVASENLSTVVSDLDKTVTVVSAGSQGPPGVSEDSMIYAKQTDFASETEIYRGEAAVGSSTASAVWRIRKLVLANDGDVSETWASGNANFDKIWDNRLALSYS